MTARSRSARNRDIALTTLIDLLVQVVFVFTLILIAVDVVDGDPQKQGWVTPDVWKTLISIFDVDPRNVREASAQLGEIKDKYDRAKDELVGPDEFDRFVAETSKLTERVVKLAGEAAQPLQNRASINAERINDLVA